MCMKHVNRYAIYVCSICRVVIISNVIVYIYIYMCVCVAICGHMWNWPIFTNVFALRSVIVSDEFYYRANSNIYNIATNPFVLWYMYLLCCVCCIYGLISCHVISTILLCRGVVGVVCCGVVWYGIVWYGVM